ncbi:MAG TPA: LysR family transcriptional regulator [Blastocatellia bacterium]|nr:LysR family transcriptional regulator [Blastocatellia bacterium]
MAGIHNMNLQTIDLNLLLVFEALMEERGVTRAAKRVGLSQPAMSNALARLRRTFGDPLFVRTTEGMSPTPAAQSLIGPVRSALAQLREIFEEKPAFAPSESERLFHLLANDYVELTLLPPLAKDIRDQATGVSLRIQRSPNVFEPPSANSLAESFDLAIGFFPDALTLDARVRSELLWEDRNICIARAKHPKIRGRISLRQYAEAEHVAVFYKKQGLGVIDTLLAQKGLARRTAVVVPHFASVPFIVSTSDFIATAPDRLAQKFIRQLRLQSLSAPIDIPPLRLTLLWHERFHADPAHRWMRELIMRTAGKVAEDSE